MGVVSAANQYEPAHYAYATIKIRVKNGASKITITPESFVYAVGNPYTLYTKDDAEKDVKALLSSYESTMQEKIDNSW
ncbi:hypothetical protein [Methyloprofundus sp.]|uniref:hypothetical protein n=1 Tax=Methyloprofundus sp. TaxID=2020875 RepID=UPI003D0DB049